MLLAHQPRQRQQLCERGFEPAVAADVADHAAEIGPQRLERKRDFLRTMTPALLTDGLRIEGGI
ncbi:hypothetical protein IVB08_16535 [Bradyrhizobium sp. 173]|nr:hypothetical protein [Bradyrhizobium sp. 173]